MPRPSPFRAHMFHNEIYGQQLQNGEKVLVYEESRHVLLFIGAPLYLTFKEWNTLRKRYEQTRLLPYEQVAPEYYTNIKLEDESYLYLNREEFEIIVSRHDKPDHGKEEVTVRQYVIG